VYLSEGVAIDYSEEQLL